jgi:hypothetical protein
VIDAADNVMYVRKTEIRRNPHLSLSNLCLSLAS